MEQQNSDKTRKVFVYYQSLLFIFPAGSLISHGAKVLDPNPSFSKLFFLFLLFAFLIVEFNTTRRWSFAEVEDENGVYQDSARRTILFFVDMIRIIFITVFFMHVSSILSSNGDVDLLSKITWFSLGCFLISNLIWNLVVTPLHQRAYVEFVEKINELHANAEHKIYRFGVNVVRVGAATVYLLQRFLFYVAFPSLGVLFVFWGLDWLDSNSVFSWVFESPLNLGIGVFGTQLAFKLLQTIALDPLMEKMIMTS